MLRDIKKLHSQIEEKRNSKSDRARIVAVDELLGLYELANAKSK